MKVGPDELVRDALSRIAGVGAVVDGNERFLGTITDAAVRRRLLVAVDPAALLCGDVLDTVPVVVDPGTSDDDVRTLLASRHVRAAAIVDGDRFLGSTHIDAPVPQTSAVALAGGRGERLQPLTFKMPKPLLQIGRTSILERTLEAFHASLVDDVWLAVNYMAEVIEERIGDGSQYGLRVRYIHEDEPLGSAGALSLLPHTPPGPVVVANTDQITNMSFARLVDYHLAERADVTVAAVPFEVSVPYGVLELRDGELVGLTEKPTVRYPCNAGYYVVDPTAIELVPKAQPFTMPELMQAVMDRGGRVAVFPMVELWLDIGNPEDLEKALLWSATGGDA